MAASKGIAQAQKPLDAHRAELAQVLPGKAAVALQGERLQAIQDDLLEKSLGVVQDAMSFAEIDRAAQQPPQEWIDELGQDRAHMRFRIAMAAWETARNAPVGIKVAAQVAVGIMKAKAQEKAAPKTLNVAFVQWNAAQTQFVEKDFERD